MNRPWLVIAASLCGLVLIGILVNHSRSTTPTEPAIVRSTSTPRSPWVAPSKSRGSAPAAARFDAPPLSDTAADFRTAEDSAGDVIRVPATPTPEGRAAAPARTRTDTRTTPIASNPGNAPPPPPAGRTDAAGPALVLSFDKSARPDAGDSAPIVEDGVSFEADGAHFAADAQFALPSDGNVDGAAGTISFWILPDWAGDDPGDASIVQLRDRHIWENRLQIFKNGPFMRFLFTDNSGIESGVGTNIRHWKRGEWHMVTATWGDGVTSLYIDGELVGDRTYDGELELNPGMPLYIGSNFPGDGPGARAALSNFQIFTRALTPDDVGVLLAQRSH